MLKTVSIKVTGKVQGVFYRQSTKEIATALGIKGEVKNNPDHTVEITATGTPEQIDRLVTWCKQGPPKAKVTNVTLADLTLKPFDNFSVIR